MDIDYSKALEFSVSDTNMKKESDQAEDKMAQSKNSFVMILNLLLKVIIFNK